MYADPKNLRANEVKLRFNDRELRVIESVADFSGQQRAVLLRELVLEGLEQLKTTQPGAFDAHHEQNGRA